MQRSFFIANKDAERAEADQRDVLHALVPTTGDSDAIGKFFYEKTRALLAGRSFVLADANILNVDILDVLKAVPLHWIMSEVVSELPIEPRARELMISAAGSSPQAQGG